MTNLTLFVIGMKVVRREKTEGERRGPRQKTVEEVGWERQGEEEGNYGFKDVIDH